jgi:hypothetical protein
LHWILGPRPSRKKRADAAKLARRPKQSASPERKGRGAAL